MSNWLMYLFSSLLILGLTGLVVLFYKKPILNADNTGYQVENFSLLFNLSNPDSIFHMPKKLREISGITNKTNETLFAINDEQPKLFTYDLSQEKIISQIDFGKKNDYEAVTKNNDVVYVASSNGDITVVNSRIGKKIEVIKTPLSSRNDVEGMCFDKKNNQLLLACKGDTEKKNKKGRKGIYSYNLTNNTFNTEPFKLIDLKEDRKNLLPINLSTNMITSLNINFRMSLFAPSGIDFDPLTGDLFILANRGRILVILGNDKNTKAIYFLPHNLYGQPEGLTFDEKGNLYISNESKSTKANILKFTRKIKKTHFEY